MKSVNPKTRTSLMDKTIRRLLFSNPSMSIEMCRKITNALKNKTEEEKELIRANLQEGLALYKEKAKESVSIEYRDNIYSQAKEHIRQWEKVYGKPSLADILSLIDSTGIKLEEIVSDYLTPNTIAEMLDEFAVH